MKIFLSFLLAFATLQLPAQLELSDEVIANVEKRIATGQNQSVAIGIIDAEGMQYYSFGQTKAEGTVVNEHSIYEIGSITKTFTGVLLAQMAIDGLVGVDDPANKYLPDHAQLPDRNGVQITLGHLSDHTSSIQRMPSNFNPADPANPYADYTTKELFAELPTLQLTRDIGSQYEYSNLAQGLLGQILSDVAGVSYEELVRQRILEPLAMDESAIILTDKMKTNLAYGHQGMTQVSNWDLVALAGAGGIRSSTHDMLRYIGANMGIIESDFMDAMEMSHYPRHDKAGGDYVGLGWHIKPGDDGDLVWHNGATGGYTAFSGFNKEKKYGVVVLTNSSTSVDDLGIHLLDNNSPLREINYQAATELRRAMDDGGLDVLERRYEELKSDPESKFVFSEDEINRLGYYYLGRKEYDAALAIFKINIDEHPESFNVYDSYGEALMEDGQKELAIENYEKSLEINPGNTNGIDMLKKLGVEYAAAEFAVAAETLKSYAGTYELAPGFNIVVTADGTQIFGQATGQQQFEMFATSETNFYLKITPAQIQFNLNDDGEVESLTLFQAGQEVVGVRK